MGIDYQTSQALRELADTISFIADQDLDEARLACQRAYYRLVQAQVGGELNVPATAPGLIGSAIP